MGGGGGQETFKELAKTVPPDLPKNPPSVSAPQPAAVVVPQPSPVQPQQAPVVRGVDPMCARSAPHSAPRAARLGDTRVAARPFEPLWFAVRYPAEGRHGPL